jgi:hypothetical protein
MRSPTGATPASIDTAEAPCEKPPSAMRVPRGVVDRVGAKGAPAELGLQSGGQGVAHAAHPRRLAGAAGEDQLDVGTPVVGGRGRSVG